MSLNPDTVCWMNVSNAKAITSSWNWKKMRYTKKNILKSQFLITWNLLKPLKVKMLSDWKHYPWSHSLSNIHCTFKSKTFLLNSKRSYLKHRILSQGRRCLLLIKTEIQIWLSFQNLRNSILIKKMFFKILTKLIINNN